jgi:hypothetical protein
MYRRARTATTEGTAARLRPGRDHGMALRARAPPHLGDLVVELGGGQHLRVRLVFRAEHRLVVLPPRALPSGRVRLAARERPSIDRSQVEEASPTAIGRDSETSKAKDLFCAATVIVIVTVRTAKKPVSQSCRERAGRSVLLRHTTRAAVVWPPERARGGSPRVRSRRELLVPSTTTRQRAREKTASLASRTSCILSRFVRATISSRLERH